MSTTAETKLEKELVEKGLDAPRITPTHIDNVIREVSYHQLSPNLMTCVIKVENGFEFTGESACVSAENFDADIGKKIAYSKARDKIWSHEAYLLAQWIYERSKTDG